MMPLMIVSLMIGLYVRWLVMFVALAIGISYFRVRQRLIHHDVRVREAGYAALLARERDAVRIAAQGY